MPTQVITISPDGSIHGLVHKRGQGIDLRQFGHTHIERVTLIEWNEGEQAWFIRWADTGVLWKLCQFVSAGVDVALFSGKPCDQQVIVGIEPLVLFDDYEDAVAAEVAVVQAMQLGYGQKNRPPDHNLERHDPGAEP